MNASELRIGNLLRDKVAKTELEVIELTKDNIVTYVIDRSKFPLEAGWGLEPIPLNEEWLLKAGFEHILNEHTNADFWQIKRKKNDYRPHITIYKNRITVGNNTGVKYFNDLHSLQNLYFALSGEELTIK